MKLLHRLLQHSRSYQGIFVAIFAVLVGSLVVAPHAHAGGPFMGGFTYIQGTDRASGKAYDDPSGLFSTNDFSHTLQVYPGDKVTFYYFVENVDAPFVDALPGVNQSFPVAVQYHQVDFTGNDTTLRTFAPINSDPLTSTYSWSRGSAAGKFLPADTNTVTVSGPGSDIPGNQLCQYVQTNPTIVNVLAYVGIGNQVIILGQHNFNKNPENMGDYLNGNLIIKGIVYAALISPPQGNFMSCVQIAYNYNLNPVISLGDSHTTQTGGQTQVTPGVSQDPSINPTQATYSKSTQWDITQVIIPKGGTQPNPNGGISDQVPCNGTQTAFFYNKTGISCAIVANGTSVFSKSGAIQSGSQFPTTLPQPSSLPDGAIVCYALSINPYMPYPTNSSTWKHAKLVCNTGTTGKYPKVQILGDDVRVGGFIDTSQSTGQLATIFGSWAEYASFSSGGTKNFASKSGLQAGAPVGTAQSQWGVLTFANANATFGRFATPTAVNAGGNNSVQRLFKQKVSASSGSIGGTVNVSTLASSPTPYYVNNLNGQTLSITGGTIAKGTTVIIIATGKVKITSDINYTSEPLSSAADIPQVVIVAHDIDIDDVVGNIDAWLVADNNNGVINTCDLAPAQTLTKDICSKHLQVNGPVFSNQLLLNRTFGSDGTTSDTLSAPAETFNNNGISYLWANNYLGSAYTARTTYQVELPPRF